MSNSVSWMLAVKTKDGMKDSFHELMHEMVASTKANEPDTHGYVWTTPNDGSTVHIYERYADSDAALLHVGNFGANYAERFMSMVDIESFDVYGDVSDKLAEVLGSLGAQMQTRLAGFVR